MTSLTASRLARFVTAFRLADREVMSLAELARHSVRKPVVFDAEQDGIVQRVPGHAFCYRLAGSIASPEFDIPSF